MMDPFTAMFDGLNPEAIERFGRPFWELSGEELTALYQARGIMPKPARPRLRVVRNDGPKMG